MLTELNTAKKFLLERFGEAENVLPGTYPVPIETSKGTAFMAVTISEDLSMSNFKLFKDEDLKESWYDSKTSHL